MFHRDRKYATIDKQSHLHFFVAFFSALSDATNYQIVTHRNYHMRTTTDMARHGNPSIRLSSNNNISVKLCMHTFDLQLQSSPYLASSRCNCGSCDVISAA
jgi:hypothetical protein